MGARFNKPPAWPQPSDGWEPARDWILDPKWSTPPTPEPPRATSTRWIPSGRRPRPARPITPAISSLNSAPPAAPVTTGPPPPAPARAPGSPSLSSLVLELGTPRTAPDPTVGGPRIASLRPTPARMLGWGSLGVVLIVVAAVTVGDLSEPPATPLVDAAHGNPANTAGSADPIETAITRAGAGTALATLAQLEVQPPGPSTGYARSKFGSALTDIDGNGCDQRNDVLRRDLTGKTLKAGSNGCTVVTGSLLDPYTGQTIRYTRAPDLPAQVQIDHVVSLGDAWLKGARDWTVAERTEFNADPLNLLAVGANVTAGKRASDAARWLPEAAGYHCTYVARQIAVKHAYGIWVTPAERAAMARILTSCASLTPPRAQVIALGGAPLADPPPAEPLTMAAARAD